MLKRMLFEVSRVFLFAAMLTVTAPASRAMAAPPEGYMDFAAISRAVAELDAHPSCASAVLGKTLQNREVQVLTLASDLSVADSKPAMLIVAGIDARHRVGPETAIRVARQLLASHADLLTSNTVYVIPCANPDGFEFNNGPVNRGHIGNMRPVDADRDGTVDEDAPQDINGDGTIAMMRRPNPPLDDVATMMADPAAPRLLKKPNPEKGERAVYSVYVEGLDVDGDGRVAEDGPGEVDPDRNFMHRWPQHEPDAGQYQLSESESAALATFVLEHRNIVQAIAYGRHDNLVNTPDSKARDITGEAPRDLDQGDADYYKEIGKLFRDITKQERAPQNDSAGSFHVWLYAQRGIPSFATVVWGRPDASKPSDGKAAETQPAESQPDEKPADERGVKLGAVRDGHDPEHEGHDEDDVALTIAQPQDQPPAGGRRRRGGGGPPSGEGRADDARDTGSPRDGDDRKPKDDKPKPADPEAAAWLEYSDRDRNGAGFIEWAPFNHPTLGNVEIGGFVPGFQMNPPADQLDGLAEKQALFIVELLKKQPKITIEGPHVARLASGLYEIRFGVVNDGYLPTATAMARRARSVMPTIVRLSTDVDHIVSGDRINKVYGITGGERWTTRWIVRADDNADLTIEVVQPQLGDRIIKFKAAATP